MQNAEHEKRWVGLDVGAVRCGVAVADASATLASPRGVLAAEPLASLGQRLAELLKGAGALGLVVGLPLNAVGKEGDSARQARTLGTQLAAALGCQAHFVDERFTTAQVHALRRAAGLRPAARRADIDAWAAAAILQTFLDQLKGTAAQE